MVYKSNAVSSKSNASIESTGLNFKVRFVNIPQLSSVVLRLSLVFCMSLGRKQMHRLGYSQCWCWMLSCVFVILTGKPLS